MAELFHHPTADFLECRLHPFKPIPGKIPVYFEKQLRYNCKIWIRQKWYLSMEHRPWGN